MRLEWAAQAGSADWLADLLFDMKLRTPVCEGSEEHEAALLDPRRAARLIVLNPDNPRPAHPIL
jgi:hypothetical protein